MSAPPSPSEAYWEPYYREGRSRWSGRPNASLVAEVGALAPGTALDLGCGQGGDAIWLASRGWRVTGADVSSSALAVAAANAEAAGVAQRIDWQQHDLAGSWPDGRFDLVATSYLHSPVELPQAQILQRAAASVAVAGTLLVIAHAPSATHRHADLPTLAELVAQLALDPHAWEVRTAQERTVEHAFAGEAPTTRTDTVIRAQRRGDAGA